MRTDPRRERGGTGEDAALAVYIRRGYRLVARNWRCKLGELDLVLVRGGTLVFCEVKARRGSAFGGGYEAVDVAEAGEGPGARGSLPAGTSCSSGRDPVRRCQCCARSARSPGRVVRGRVLTRRAACRAPGRRRRRWTGSSRCRRAGTSGRAASWWRPSRAPLDLERALQAVLVRVERRGIGAFERGRQMCGSTRPTAPGRWHASKSRSRRAVRRGGRGQVDVLLDQPGEPLRSPGASTTSRASARGTAGCPRARTGTSAAAASSGLPDPVVLRVPVERAPQVLLALHQQRRRCRTAGRTTCAGRS